MPGVATPTEAFLALSAGADVLKLFPGEAIGPAVLRAWRPIFPGVRLFPVGGVRPDHFGDWLAAGADGFGLGTALYRPGLGHGIDAEGLAAGLAALRAGFGMTPV